VIVVDSSALVAIASREPEADSFLQVIATADGCLLSSLACSRQARCWPVALVTPLPGRSSMR
jgi:uncharacterized protein with PIN domain